MQRDILFYQANFDPEVARAIDALEKGDGKHFVFFRNKTLKIVSEILSLSKKYFEKEEWFAIYNMVKDMEYLTPEEFSLLKNYGLCFSAKFARRLTLSD